MKIMDTSSQEPVLPWLMLPTQVFDELGVGMSYFGIIDDRNRHTDKRTAWHTSIQHNDNRRSSINNTAQKQGAGPNRMEQQSQGSERNIKNAPVCANTFSHPVGRKNRKAGSFTIGRMPPPLHAPHANLAQPVCSVFSICVRRRLMIFLGTQECEYACFLYA